MNYYHVTGSQLQPGDILNFAYVTAKPEVHWTIKEMVKYKYPSWRSYFAARSEWVKKCSESRTNRPFKKGGATLTMYEVKPRQATPAMSGEFVGIDVEVVGVHKVL